MDTRDEAREQFIAAGCLDDFAEPADVDIEFEGDDIIVAVLDDQVVGRWYVDVDTGETVKL